MALSFFAHFFRICVFFINSRPPVNAYLYGHLVFGV
jgi:hypothetical protein